jgi:hypothetical protein
MKRFAPLFSLLLSLLPVCLAAQSLTAHFNIGAGASYLVEHLDQRIDIQYGPLSTFAFGLSLGKETAYFRPRLELLNVNTGIWGRAWTDGSPIDGQVNSFTTLFSLEHLPKPRPRGMGYFMGMGYTHEQYDAGWFMARQEIRNFFSVTVGGIGYWELSPTFALELRPFFLWTDPASSFSPRGWSIAREDLSFLLQIGLRYTLSQAE